MTYDGSLRFDTKMDTKGFNSGISTLTSSFGKLTGIIKLVGTAIATSFIAKSITSCIGEAEKLQNAMTGLKSIMEGQGKSFANAQKFINEYTKDGLIPANNAITAYKNLALRGYNTDQIEKVMNALKDSATYSRQSSYTLGEAVQTASEGLKNENSILVDNAGVTKNVAKMWQDYAKSIGKSSTALTQQEKIQAEVNGILEETKFQTGDAQTYMNSYSGQVARLNQLWLTFKQSMGSAFMTLAQTILPILNTIMQALVKVANVFSAVVTKIFGKFVNSNNNIAKSGKQASTAISGVGDSAKEAGNKVKDALLPFDDLNVLQEEIASGSSGGVDSGLGGILDDFNELNNLEIGSGIKLSPKIENIIEKFKEWGTLINRFVKKYVSGVKQVIEPLGDSLFKPLQEFASQRYSDVWDEFIQGGEKFVQMWEESDVFDSLERIWAVLGPILEKVGEFFVDIQSWMSELIVSEGWIGLQGALQYIELVLRGIAQLLEGDVSGAFQTFTTDMNKARQENFDEHVSNISEKFTDLKDRMTDWANTFKEKFKEVIDNWKTKIADWWRDDVEPWFTKEKWETTLSNIATSMGIAVGKFTSTWVTKIVEWWRDDVEPWFTKEKWVELFNNIVNAVSTTWEKIKSSVKILFNNWMQDVKNANSKEKWAERFEGIKAGLIGAVLEAIESIKRIFNNFWNGFSIGIGQHGGGGINLQAEGGFETYSMPHLATGAVIPPNAEFTAVLGDQRNGRNLEAPEDLIRQIVREEAGNSVPQTIINKIYLDKREIAQAIKEVNEEESRASRGFLGGGAFAY